MELWIARDKSQELCLYTEEPVRYKGTFIPKENEDCILLFSDEFPEVTWENSPKKVELKIIE